MFPEEDTNDRGNVSKVRNENNLKIMSPTFEGMPMLRNFPIKIGI